MGGKDQYLMCIVLYCIVLYYTVYNFINTYTDE